MKISQLISIFISIDVEVAIFIFIDVEVAIFIFVDVEVESKATTKNRNVVLVRHGFEDG